MGIFSKLSTTQFKEDRISPKIGALVARGNVTHAELSELRCNSWEWEALVPAMTDDAFLDRMQHSLDNCFTTRNRPFSTYNQAVEGLWGPGADEEISESGGPLKFNWTIGVSAGAIASVLGMLSSYQLGFGNAGVIPCAVIAGGLWGFTFGKLSYEPKENIQKPHSDRGDLHAPSGRRREEAPAPDSPADILRQTREREGRGRAAGQSRERTETQESISMTDEKDPPNNVVSLELLKGGKSEPGADELKNAETVAAFAMFYQMAKEGRITEYAITVLETSGDAKVKNGPLPLHSLAFRGAMGVHLHMINNNVQVTK